MGKTGYNTKRYSSHDQPTLAVWRHWTILEEDDGGGPRLPHGESVPPRERNCKLDLYEPELTLTYPHSHLTSLNSMGEPTQTRSRGRRCLSWRKVQRRWRFQIGEWDEDKFLIQIIILTTKSSGSGPTSRPSATRLTTTCMLHAASTRTSWWNTPVTCWPDTSPSLATSTAGGSGVWGEEMAYTSTWLCEWIEKN